MLGTERKVTDEQQNKAHRAASDIRGRKNKLKRQENARQTISEGHRPKHPSKAFAVNSVVRARRILQVEANTAQKAAKLPYKHQFGDYPPPDSIAIIGASGVGKTTLVKTLVRCIVGTTLTTVAGPITLVASKTKRLTLFDVPSNLPAVIDAAKMATLVLIVVDATKGLEAPHYEYLNVLQSTGFPRVYTVFTHLDLIKNVNVLNQTKTRLRERIWKELEPGSRVFYMKGLHYNKAYLKNDAQLLIRIIAQQEHKLGLRWRDSHGGILVDRIEDLTDPGLLSADKELNKLVKHTIAFFGYVRGTYLDAKQMFYMPGGGTLSIESITKLPDPCECVEQMKKRESNQISQRRLGSRVRSIYAPFCNDGDIFYDKDGLWFNVHNTEASTKPSLKTTEDLPRGLQMLQELAELDVAAVPEPGIQLLDDAEESLGSISVPSSAPSEDSIDENPFIPHQNEGNTEERAMEQELVDGQLEESSEGREDVDLDRVKVELHGRQEDYSLEDHDEEERDETVLKEDEEEDREQEEIESEKTESIWSHDAYHSTDSLLYKSVKLVTSEGAGRDLMDMVYNLNRLNAIAQTTRKAVLPTGSRALRTRAQLRSLFDEGEDTYGDDQEAELDVYSIFLTNESRLAGIPLKGYEGLRDVSNVIPETTTYERDCPLLLSHEMRVSGLIVRDLDMRRIKNSFVTGDWSLANVLDDVLKGQEFVGKPITASEGLQVADDGVLEIGYEPGEKEPQAPTNKEETATAEVDRIVQDLAPDNSYLEKKKEALEAEERRNRELQNFDDEYRFAPGTYVRVVAKDLDDEFTSGYKTINPIVLGVTLPGEQQYAYITAKIKKHRWHAKILKTGNPVFVTCGWRRFQTIAYFAMEQQGSVQSINSGEALESGRYRMLKYTPENMYCYCTFWGPVVPAGTGVAMFDTFEETQKSFRISATGIVINTSSEHKVYKKLKLIGRPARILKGTAFITGMFSSRLEATAFIGAGLKTVSGIRGIIKKAERVPEGNVRAKFEDRIATTDIVFMRMYVPIKIIKFCNEFLDHYYGSGQTGPRLRTIAELRHANNIPIPINPDSIYTQKTPRKVAPFIASEHEKEIYQSLPRNLLRSLPFKHQHEIMVARQEPEKIKDPYLRSLTIPDKREHARDEIIKDLTLIRGEQQRLAEEQAREEEKKRKAKEDEHSAYLRLLSKDVRARKRIIRQQLEDKKLRKHKV
ncbi:Ribosome biogenesis protein BMS1 [Giardia muris]|uniref:Ribosome biogenesis protein BMS1 n=1 Tax=Giardia muris TaxID=5742 RepID=A0A4Z1SS79_GIAMU|nr:Ribosome biogenesis protein BMS1 [Giardia muris]|eukprot:TNJ28620.1 Ribosome biogenesis protein BMS1 [Giardia muris]